MWWIGDWLNYGEKQYGETYAKALDVTDYNYDQLAKAKWVSSKYEPWCRHQKLSYTHHREALGADNPVEILEWAEQNKASVKDLRTHA